MQNDNTLKGNFLNRRDWGSYLTALQNAAIYPDMWEAVKWSRDWFTKGAEQASTWLVGGTAELQDKLTTG